MRYHCAPIWMAEIKKIIIVITLNAWEVAGKLDHSYVAGGNVKWSSHCGKWVAASYKIKYVIITQSSNCTLGHLSQGKKK